MIANAAHLLLILNLVVEIQCEAAMAVRFKVVHEAIFGCPNSGTDEIQFRWHLRKLNKTTETVSGQINFLRDFDDTLWVRAKLWSWQNGGWKGATGMDLIKDKGCSTFTTLLGPVWKAIVRNAHMPRKCPYKKGTSYNMTEIDTRVWEKLPVPGIPVKKFRLEFSWETADKVKRGCYASIFKVEKKSVF